MEVYRTESPISTGDPPNYRGVSTTKPLDAAKEAVTVLELAVHLAGQGTPRGAEVAFHCPLPRHDDRHPSFMVNPESNVWYCFPCGVGGNVVELARRAWDYPDDGRGAAEAAMALLLEFGHELPQRPPSWFAKQERQAPIRDAIYDAKIMHLRRRIYRRFFQPAVLAIEDEQERQSEGEMFWAVTRPLARMLVADLEKRKEDQR